MLTKGPTPLTRERASLGGMRFCASPFLGWRVFSKLGTVATALWAVHEHRRLTPRGPQARGYKKLID